MRPICVDHMKLPVGDLERSVAFYRAALVGGPLRPTNHLAFAATDFAQVGGIPQGGTAAGGRDNGAPGPGLQYSPGYHGAFLLDPDGHNDEAVWHAPVEDR